MADLVTIKKIKTAAGEHSIDAEYWGGHSFSEITDLVHGVVDTYVIPAQTTGTSDYKAIVESSSAQVTTTKTKLASLVGQPNDFDKFGIGDIILMGATSDGKVNFDRWISSVSGDNITLDVLETQVATHHHTISGTSAKAITGVTTTSTTNTLAKVGTAVNVVTGVSGDPSVVTSVTFVSNTGGHSFKVATATSTDTNAAGHKHDIDPHSHTFNPTTLVSETVEVYNELTTATHAIHTHSTTNVAAVAASDSKITFATTVKTSSSFIKSLKDSDSQDTGSASPTTQNNTTGLSTSVQLSTDTIGDIVKTTSTGAHEHTVSTTTTSNVVTSVDIAPNVTTSAKLNYEKPNVAGTVVTTVSLNDTVKILSSASISAPTTTVVASFVPTVNASGILSFESPTSNVVTSAAITVTSKTVKNVVSYKTTTQSAGSATLTVTSATQTYTSGKVSASGSAASAGAHQHGFSHVHAIPAHSHTVNGHTHTYVKTVASEKGMAITEMNTSSYQQHKHGTATVVSQTNAGTPITYVTGGTKTSVIMSLINSATTSAESLETDHKFYNLTGSITMPTLSAPTSKLSTMLSSKSITPAAAGEKAIASITLDSSNFIASLTEKTSSNKGGN